MKPILSGGLVHDLPVDLAEALTEKVLIDTWEALSAIGRNEFICWVEDAKQQKTRAKRIVRATEELQEGKRRPCCWVGCIHRTDKKPGKWQQDVLIDKKNSNKMKRTLNKSLHLTQRFVVHFVHSLHSFLHKNPLQPLRK